MIHVKIHCDDCKEDVEVTCEGVYIVMRKPYDRPETSFRHTFHHMNSIELVPEIMRYLLPDLINRVRNTAEDAKFKEWLKSMGVNLD